MKKFVCFLGQVILWMCVAGIIINAIMFPEKYISTWKYQLENEVRAGEPEAVEYYEARYLSRGIELF